MTADDDIFHAAPQIKGRMAHQVIDEKNYSTKRDIIVDLPVFSDELGLIGKIDIYKSNEKSLIERKYQIKKIYKGKIYQLWAQYFCMTEMGYCVEDLSFYSMLENKTYPIDIPSDADKKEMIEAIANLKNFDPDTEIPINENRCRHCIYCNLCYKTEVENVYS